MSDVAPEVTDTDPEPAPAAAADTGPTLEERLAALEAQRVSGDRASVMAQVLGRNAQEPMGQFFATRYEGPLTPEAVREAAEALGLASDPGAEADAANFRLATDLRTGAVPPGSDPGPDPRARAQELALEARKVTTSDNALGVYIDALADSAVRGDRRILIDNLAGLRR